MKRLLAAIIFVLCIAAAANAADGAPKTGSATIEVSNGAILISGGRDTVRAIRDALKADCSGCSTLESAAEFIWARFPNAADIKLFRKSDLPSAADISKLDMPLRRALLLGLIPPIEGLDFDKAKTVLAAAGISLFSADEWKNLGMGLDVALASSSSREIVIVSGFSPQDTVTIVFTGGKK